MGRHAARRPCPFCGWPYADLRQYKSATHPDYHKWWVRCCGCDAYGPMVDTKGEATTAWNRRIARGPLSAGQPVPLDLPR